MHALTRLLDPISLSYSMTDDQSGRCSDDFVGDLYNPYDDGQGYLTPGGNMGWWLANSWSNGDPYCNDGGRQPMYFQDKSSCWLDSPYDMIQATNSLWLQKDAVFSGNLPCLEDNCPNDFGVNDQMYWGWNEVPCTNNIDDPSNWDAVIIKLPPGAESLCQLDDDKLQHVVDSLTKDDGSPLKDEGWSGRPVVTLVESKDDFSWIDGNSYWGYKKWFSSQEFVFPDGSCLARGDDNEVYYWAATDVGYAETCTQVRARGFDNFCR